MALLRVLKFSSLDELNLGLQGGILGGTITGEFWNLVGKRLTFTTPSGHVDFAQVGGADMLRFGDVKDQVEAAVTAVKVFQIGGKIAFVQADPNNGPVVLAANSVSPAGINQAFGFPAGSASTGVVYGKIGAAAPSVQAIYSCADSTHNVLVLV